MIIAVHATGQILYYSRRLTIDMLGISDPVFARGKPGTTRFRPVHNKWNYDYSINELKPGLVADEWGRVKRYLSKIRAISVCRMAYMCAVGPIK